MFLFFFTLPHMALGHQFDLPFFVELWDEKDSHIEKVIALTADYATTCNVSAAISQCEMERYGELPRLQLLARLLECVYRGPVPTFAAGLKVIGASMSPSVVLSNAERPA